jgi:hypothetical protein
VPKIQFIKNAEIRTALEKDRRHYLVGDFSQPLLIKDPTVEMGITIYKQYTCEDPHYHTRTTTYEYIIEGNTKYYDITNNCEYCFSQGDTVVIPPEIIYAQKSLAKTVIVFFKFPSGDKISIEVDAKVKHWLEEWNNTI